MSLIGFLIVGLIAGWLAGVITKGRGFGLIGNLVVGVVGAVIGGFLLRMVGVYSYGFLGELVTATLGAIVLLWIASLVRK